MSQHGSQLSLLLDLQVPAFEVDWHQGCFNQHCNDKKIFFEPDWYHSKRISHFQSQILNNAPIRPSKACWSLARNIWLNYEGRRPEFSQNGGYAAGFAERLKAIACHITADFVMLACCRLNFYLHMPSTHIYPSFYKSCVMLHYSQFSKWPKISPQPKLKSNKNFHIGMTQIV